MTARASTSRPIATLDPSRVVAVGRAAASGCVCAGVEPPLGVSSGSSWASSSCAVCQRSAGCLARQRITTAESVGDREGRYRLIGAGCSVT